jgi:hypothetical protein
MKLLLRFVYRDARAFGVQPSDLSIPPRRNEYRTAVLKITNPDGQLKINAAPTEEPAMR